MSDPLLPHLLDIISEPCSDGLILAGGFGIRLKQNFRRANRGRTLISHSPEARATQDMDFFLSLSFFEEKSKGAAVRELLDRLSYRPVVESFQFAKPLGGGLPQSVKVDLLARWPDTQEIRVKPPRVGSGSGINLHGRVTPEGFSVEQSPLKIPVSGAKSDGSVVSASVAVPHSYSWLNLKTQAAYDWLRMQRNEMRQKPNSEKHVLDVYLLTAMLTEVEMEESAVMAKSHKNLAKAQEIQAYAKELFGGEDAPGNVQLRRLISKAPEPAFYEGLWTALGIP